MVERRNGGRMDSRLAERARREMWDRKRAEALAAAPLLARMDAAGVNSLAALALAEGR